ncbi:tyrosine-type recombinase/integrase [Arcanobacterium buesumense]|uniref:Site-specific integrase n=1 Tax=Arcanobacterium buesumense TaxID=2722751 RepID=A0A6H2ELU2_9ACTO|nr:site-specific integrase [Arcanobacterium buesumense]QJC22040.1 site-specific integrase [Arcanobacterium buesumense]
MIKGIEPRRRADGTVSYRVRFRIEKGANPTTETFDNLADAQAFRQLVDSIGGKAARELRDASDTSLAIKTIEDVLEVYIARVDSYGARGTGEDYRRVAKRTWLKFFPDKMPISTLTKTAVESWIAWQRSQPTRTGGFYSPKSIRNAQGILSSVCEYAIEQGIISSNPAKGVKIPRDQAKKEKMYLTGEQIAKILEHLPERFHPLILLIYSTGIRRGEAIALTPADFDFDANPATVRIEKAFKKDKQGSYLGSPKSRAAYRTITLPANVVAVLEPFVRSFEKSDALLFHSPKDPARPMNLNSFVDRHWHKATAAAGIDGNPGLHDLRHSHASALIKLGTPLPVIQRRLGHESIQTTVDTYGHLSRESWAGAAEAIGTELSPALPEIAPPKQITTGDDVVDAEVIEAE